ncbi:MAG: DUF3021 family protein [Ruminococcaceae bacterium]|nr:DUF3021 family protein [Oscillospiraceae bacterium]
MENKSIWSVFKSIYRKIVLPACLLHTVITFVFMMGSELDAIKLDKAGLIFLFSLMVALSNLLFSLKNMQILLRTTLHFICTSVSFVVIMLYGSGSMKSNSSGSLMILMVYIVLYLLIAPLPVYFIHKKEKKNEEATEYQSIYKK